MFLGSISFRRIKECYLTSGSEDKNGVRQCFTAPSFRLEFAATASATRMRPG